MKIVEKMLFRPVNDPLQMPEEMIQLENELIEQGYDILPRGGPVIILKLDGGEVHYCPGDGGIWRFVFECEPDNAE